MNSVVDIFLLYQFLRRLATPFEKWEAFKAGVIDKDGNILIAPKDRERAERDSFQKFDLLVLKLKKLMAKIPGGASRIASFAAALYLIKENDDAIEFADSLTEEDLLEQLNKHIGLVEAHSSVNDRFELFEETTQAGSGLVDHSKSMGKKLKKGDKPAEDGTPELVRRYRKATPGEFKEEQSVDKYKARSVGPNTMPADLKGHPLGSKRPIVKKKSEVKSTDVNGNVTQKIVSKDVSGEFKGQSRSELKVGSDDRTKKR